MFVDHAPMAATLAAPILEAADAAARAIPPAFPLEATVAVNPFLGQAGMDLAHAAALLARVGGVALTQPRAQIARQVAAGRITDDDLAAALIAHPSPLKPADLALLRARLHGPAPAPRRLPTVADLAARAARTDWPGVIARSTGLWAAGRFDGGQALWSPRPGEGAFRSWRDWAMHDLTPEIAGLSGFCDHVAGTPDTADRAILRAAAALGIDAAAAPTAFHRLLIDWGGWAQHARWLSWQAELSGSGDATLTDLLAIRLIWDEALLARHPDLEPDWRATLAAHAEPVAPTADQVLDAILQDAAERAHQRRLAGQLGSAAAPAGRPAMQAAFCIDVRSEVLRRALEDQDEGIETIGFAGFFGLPVAFRPEASDSVQAHLPVLLAPRLTATAQGPAPTEAARRIAARARRAWGRFRQAAVSSFAFVEAAGPAYGPKLLRDALGRGHAPDPGGARPRFDPPLPAADKVRTAAGILRAMGLTGGHARLVLLVGHGAGMVNNPHHSAYHCGACGGRSGDVSARLLAALLNDPETRAGLAGQGVALPGDTVFVGALHDTVTDRVTLFPDGAEQSHAADLDRARGWLDAAGRRAGAERAMRLPGAGTVRDLARRTRDWSEPRPEWGLAGCSAFIAAPRGVTRGRDLGGRVFLHSYDWRSDEGFATLELILTAPMIVASWINLHYHGATVAPALFGGGNKMLHNVTGGLGVVEGNGGVLRPGLPWQAVHDGIRPAHEPLRLSVLLEAPAEAIDRILAAHEMPRQLVDHGWISLFALSDGRMAARRRPGGGWQAPH